MKLNPVSHLLTIPVASTGIRDLMHLQACLGALLPQVPQDKSFMVAIIWNDNGAATNCTVREMMERWSRLAACRDVNLLEQFYDRAEAAATILFRTLLLIKPKWWINMDCDIVVSPEWGSLIRAHHAAAILADDMLIYNRQDVKPSGFPGWTMQAASPVDAAEIQREYGDHGLIFRQWESSGNETTVTVTNVWVSAFIARVSVLFKETADGEQLRTKLLTWKKGLRGYDRYVCEYYMRHSGKVRVALGTNTYHMGEVKLLGEGTNYIGVDHPDASRFMPQIGEEACV